MKGAPDRARPWPRPASSSPASSRATRSRSSPSATRRRRRQPLTGDTGALATALAGLGSDHQSGHGAQRRRRDRRQGARHRPGRRAPRADRDDRRQGLLVARDDEGASPSRPPTTRSRSTRSRCASEAVRPDVLQQLAGATGGSFRRRRDRRPRQRLPRGRRRAREDLRAQLPLVGVGARRRWRSSADGVIAKPATPPAPPASTHDRPPASIPQRRTALAWSSFALAGVVFG